MSNEGIIIHPAGASSGSAQKRGPGGFAAIITAQGQPTMLVSGNHGNTTANRMAVTALLSALQTINASDPGRMLPIQIRAASEYVVNPFNQGWLESWTSNGWRKADGRALPNRDLWRLVQAELGKRPRKVTRMTTGMQDHFTELCASLAASEMNDPQDPGGQTTVQEINPTELAICPEHEDDPGQPRDIDTVLDAAEKLLGMLRDMATAR